MYRSVAVGAALLAAVGAVSAQTTYNPKVAYTLMAGKTHQLYLANADGTGAVRVASGAGDVSGDISGVDFAPGGGRIAYADRAGLKVLSYTATSTGIQVLGIVTLVAARVSSPDFSDDGSRILFYRSGTTADLSQPSGFRAVAATGGTPVMLYQTSSLGQGRWLRSADMGKAFAFLKTVPQAPTQSSYEIWTVLLNEDDSVRSVGPTVSTTNQTFKAIEDFDIAHTRNALLITVNYPTTIGFVEFDIPTNQVASYISGPGFRGHYSADDSRIIFRNLPGTANSTYLVNSLDLSNGQMTSLATTRKGGFGFVDAQP